jgi:hypothetical protein
MNPPITESDGQAYKHFVSALLSARWTRESRDDFAAAMEEMRSACSHDTAAYLLWHVAALSMTGRDPLPAEQIELGENLELSADEREEYTAWALAHLPDDLSPSERGALTNIVVAQIGASKIVSDGSRP